MSFFCKKWITTFGVYFLLSLASHGADTNSSDDNGGSARQQHTLVSQQPIEITQCASF
jgi:hypothetical protein